MARSRRAGGDVEHVGAVPGGTDRAAARAGAVGAGLVEGVEGRLVHRACGSEAPEKLVDEEEAVGGDPRQRPREHFAADREAMARLAIGVHVPVPRDARREGRGVRVLPRPAEALVREGDVRVDDRDDPLRPGARREHGGGLFGRGALRKVGMPRCADGTDVGKDPARRKLAPQTLDDQREHVGSGKDDDLLRK